MATVMNKFFVETPVTIDASFSTTAGRNSMAVGPVTISDGVVLTITTGTVLAII